MSIISVKVLNIYKTLIFFFFFKNTFIIAIGQCFNFTSDGVFFTLISDGGGGLNVPLFEAVIICIHLPSANSHIEREKKM